MDTFPGDVVKRKLKWTSVVKSVAKQTLLHAIQLLSPTLCSLHVPMCFAHFNTTYNLRVTFSDTLMTDHTSTLIRTNMAGA